MNQIETILKSSCGHLNGHLEVRPIKRPKVIKARNDCPEVQKMFLDLKYWCIEKEIRLEKEFKFSKKKKFRFDFCLPDHHIGIEYDGLNSKKSGHTTLLGYTSDTEKINLAISQGWRVLRYTVLNYQNILQDVEKLIKK